MSTNHEFNQNALNWVKDEVDESLHESSLALEAFAENTDDTTQLRFYLNHLYQVEGILQMLELSGANLLITETKALALGMLEHNVEVDTPILEALMQSTLLLQDYLKRLKSGKKDHPISVLPVVNELRTVYGTPPLAPTDLFNPDLTVPLPDTLTPNHKVSEDELRSIATKLRLPYETALLHWFRNPSGEGLSRLAKVVTELREHSQNTTIFRLWWLSQGVIEALQEGGLQPIQEIKLLLGSLDKKIKILAQEGETALAASITETLLKSLLLQIANATSSGIQVTKIKEIYQLEHYLPSDRVLLTSLGSEVIETVLAAFREDLAQAKDLLDIFERTHEQSPSDLESLYTLLQKMADTLEVLGLIEPLPLLREQKDQLAQLKQKEAKLDGEQHLELANALLQIETSLEKEAAFSYHFRGSFPPANPSSDTHRETVSTSNSGGEVRAVQHAVARECLSELAVVTQALTDYSKNPVDPQVLVPLPDKLQQTAEVLSVLGLSRISDLLIDCHRFVYEAMIEKTEPTSPTNLEKLAEAISAIELYLEMLAEGVLATGTLLDTAANRLDSLLESLDHPTAEPLVTAEEAGTTTTLEPSTSEIPDDTANTTSEISTNSLSQTTWEIPSAPVYPEGVDAEIATYFVEEAQEEIASLTENFPQWRQDPSQQEPLKAIRRSFHTLKGSGRLVGAADLGEFAWAIESLLNRVLEGTLEANPSVFEIIEGAQQALPQLLLLFTQGGGNPTEDILKLGQRAHTLANRPANPIAEENNSVPEYGETKKVCSHPKATSASSKEPPPAYHSKATEERKPTSTPDPSLVPKQGPDPELLAAFLDEADDILEAAGSALADWRASPQESTPMQQLQRELHTLKGGARLANLSVLGDLSHDLESLIKTVVDRGLASHNEFFELLQEGQDRLAEMCDAIRQGAALLAANDLSSRIQRLALSLQAETSPAVADKPSAPSTVTSTPDTEGPNVTIDPNNELVAAFLEEADELLQASQASLLAWQDTPSEQDSIEEFQRGLHTLKGGARLAGITPLADLAHHMETVVSLVVGDKQNIEPTLFELLQRCLDRLCTLRDCAQESAPLPLVADLLDEMRRYDLPTSEPGQGDAQASFTPSESEQNTGAAPLPSQEKEAHKVAHLPSENRTTPVEQVRVRADLLDHLVNNAAEVNIFSTRVKQQVGTVRLDLGEMTQTIARLRGQIRRLEIETEAQILYRHEETHSAHLEEFDPLEMDRYSQLHQLSRGLIESISDLTNIQETLDETAREAEALLLQQSRIGTELQQGLMNTRMLPFTGIAPRLQRIVRQTAQELNKKVRLDIVDGGLELDRTVLNRIIAPLEHMLRNSIAHGIETPSERLKANKDEVGLIRLSLVREGSEILIQVSDDGRGIDLDRVRTKALAQGLVQENAMPPDEDLVQLILESGFSTADKISQISGRGVGMDVVNSEIHELNGTLHITSKKGTGTTFTIRLPLTLTIVQALLVEAGDELFAVPISSVSSIVRLDYKTVSSLLSKEQPLYQHGDMDYRFIHLGSALGQEYPELTSSHKHYPVLLVQSGNTQSAVLVDTLVGNREIVIKSIGPQLGAIKEITGATILGDGRVILILDLPALIRKAIQQPKVITHIKSHTDSEVSKKPLVTVVDDSITIRKTTQKLLERHGMEVLTARDGVDAVEQLQERVPDIFLLDIEMPRMDGFELATLIRKDEQMHDTPIIIVTSRSGQKHRDRAEQIGVNAYLVKPYQEEELLKNIQTFLSTTPSESDATV